MPVKMISRLAVCIPSLFLLFNSFSTVQAAACYTEVKTVHYHRPWYCSCWWWYYCTHYRWIWRPYYTVTRRCCPGYYGSNCDIPSCSCQNGGTCVAPNVCRCPSGYTGNSCQTPICPGGCRNGNCASPNYCRCYGGYSGTDCSTPVCNPSCNNGGTCVSPNTCRCPSNRAGPTCNEPLCNPECLNGGTCNQQHKCNCPATYTGSRCETPTCNPSCKNGGSCVSPNTCSCPATYTGGSCENPLCAHHDPCFPGECRNLLQCTCLSGFSGEHGLDRCNNFEADNTAIITKCSAFLANIERTGKKREMYRFMTDSSEPNSTEVDMLWLSQKNYNYINADFSAIYVQPDITTQPDYIEEFKFGIIGGWLQLDLTKVPRNTSGKAFVSLNSTTYPCSNQPGSLNPETSVYSCNVTHFDFDRLLEDGDNLTVTVIALNGGYRKLKTSRTSTNATYFVGRNSSKSMMYRFDFRKPHHCILDTQLSCSSKPFMVHEDITKNPIRFSWDGWEDVLSGIGKYTIQEFLLQPNQNVNPSLTEPDPWSPTKTFTFNTTVRTFSYTPSQPGMYSFILNVVDRANNSEYARTLVLYDNTSSITTDEAFPIISTSAVKETNYQWQNNLTNDITISWKGHFRNVLHENEKFLIPVTDYSHFDHDKKFEKLVLSKLDDNDGNRTLNAIRNIHGIVKFEYDFGNANQGSQAPTNWQPINDLTETVTFFIPRRNGDTLNVWIKATDVLGNKEVDLMHVYFDETPPANLTTGDVRFIPNLKNSTFPFTSRLLVNTHDKNSGIHKIDWAFLSNQTGDLFKSGSIPGNKTNTTLKYTEGYDVPMGDNFYYSHYLDIDNCWMVVPKESFRNESIKLSLTVYNRAMESTTYMKMLSNLESLDGIDEYSGPTNLHLENTYDNGVRLRWTVTPSCYERTRIIVLVVAKDGKTYTRLVDKDADYFDLTGLDAETVYNLSFVTAYAAQKSDPVYLSFRTTESPAALTAGGIAGISIVMILLLGIIVVGVIMWRTGRLTVAKQNIQRRVTVVRERIQNRFSASHFNMTYEDQDDIYLYGGKEINTSDDYIIPHSSVVLETLLTSGRFADIYKIRYHPQNSTSRGDKYVAKVLKNGYTEEQQISMRAKINFYATKVGEHTNILHFYGAVFDDMALGPYMVLEYCELGQLNTWLQEQKSSANEETSEQLCRIVYGISKGMLHFENRKLVHRRLAARNVLLTSELEPKIYGFCPQQQTTEGDHKDDDGDVKDDKERIPIKWAAPECLVSMKYATPKSDVWSFGIVLWEIFSFGDVPYPGVRSRDVQMHLRNGNRMNRPEFANDFYYNLMKQCWQRKAKQRPSFNDITAEIGKTFNTVPSDDFYYYSEKQ